jgi:prefoldin subunit 5
MQVQESEVSDVFEFLKRRIAALAGENAVLEAKLVRLERENAEVRALAQEVADEAELAKTDGVPSLEELAYD